MRFARHARMMVLVAIVMGAALGAMACAASLAGGGGHHVQAAEPVEPAHEGHGHAGHGHAAAATTDPLPPAHDRALDGGVDHPGMACIVEVSLRGPEPAGLASAETLDLPSADRLRGIASESEPPVPRCS